MTIGTVGPILGPNLEAHWDCCCLCLDRRTGDWGQEKIQWIVVLLEHLPTVQKKSDNEDISFDLGGKYLDTGLA